MLSGMTSVSENTGVLRMHNDFTLFTRVVPSGKKVVYYYAYDDGGQRKGPWSTGQGNKTQARNYCNRLIKQGALIPNAHFMPTFAEWAKDFWDADKSAYLKDRKKRRALTENYFYKGGKVTNKNLLPYFGEMKLDQITGDVIEGWLDFMIGEGYKNTSCNSYYSTLQTMIKYAAKKGVIARDPFLDVEKLLNDADKRIIYTQDEFKALFVENWKKVWNNDLLVCLANKLAALTGLRCSEILGLRGEYVFEDHIYICAQYDKFGYRPTKTKTEDNIPLAGDVISDLKKLMTVNGNGFVFSINGGETPVTEKHIYNGLRKALVNIGISEEERTRRNLDVHAWRHFCNTELLKAGLSVPQVQAVTRHKSARMTEYYAHFNPTEFTRATEVQIDLLKPKAGKKRSEALKTDESVLKLVKPAEIDPDELPKKRRLAS